MAKETGIPFIDEMVRAERARIKTQTRRLLKEPAFDPFDVAIQSVEIRTDGCIAWYLRRVSDGGISTYEEMSRFGAVGDLLWVRENLVMDDCGLWHYKADNAPVLVTEEDEAAMVAWAHHKQNDFSTPRFMPKWATRTWLTVIEQRIQHVQDITEEDAVAEGALAWVSNPDVNGLEKKPRAWDHRTDRWCRYSRLCDPNTPVATARGAFAALWDSIHGEDSEFSWRANPRVIAVTFNRVQEATGV